MRRAYICHPYASDPEGNIAKATELLRKYAADSINEMDNQDLASRVDEYSDVVIPLCPLLVFPKFMSEGPGGVKRAHAMAFCIGLLEACDELWVCSRTISNGMAQEISFASKHGIKIVWKC